jgi:hypothetical protein
MSTQEFESVRTFLRDHVEAYEHLEVLLLMSRDGHRTWTPAEVAAVLNLPVPIVSATLDHLRAHHVLETVAEAADTFRYRPESPDAAECVAALHRAYESDRLSIVKVMSANALERLRTSTIRTFADAFRLRRRKDDA